MNDTITFEYEEKQYSAPANMYDLDRVVLPDGRLLQVEGGWKESFPPKPNGFSEIKLEYKAQLKPAAIAHFNKAVLATEIIKTE